MSLVATGVFEAFPRDPIWQEIADSKAQPDFECLPLFYLKKKLCALHRRAPTVFFTSG